MGKKILLLVLAVAVLAAGATYVLTDRTTAPTTADKPEEATEADAQPNTPDGKRFAVPMRSKHHVSNNPAHGSILEQSTEVSVTFDAELGAASTVKIELDGKDYSEGEVIISENKRMLRKVMQASAPEGVYTVKYRACWPDKSCHDGSFQFAIK